MSDEMNDGQGTPHKVLIDEIMSISLGKTEREWAAHREIANLRADNTRLKLIAADAEDGAAALSEALGEVARLKAELTALREGVEAAISDWDAWLVPARVIVRLRELVAGGEKGMSKSLELGEDYSPVPSSRKQFNIKIKDGAGLIAAERKRQVEEEGWTPEHDASHSSMALALAGAAYVLSLAAAHSGQHGAWRALYLEAMSRIWPFDEEWWKPTPDDPVRQLVKAGALIAAEIDRLRTLLSGGGSDG